MSQNMVFSIIALGAFAMVVLTTFFKARFDYLQNVELIKLGINPNDKRIPRQLLRHLVLSIPGQYSIISGILLLALGLGFVIAFVVTGLWQNEHYMGGLAFSLASVLGGTGFIAHWKLTEVQRERALKIQEEMLLSQKFDLDSAPEKKQEE